MNRKIAKSNVRRDEVSAANRAAFPARVVKVFHQLFGPGADEALSDLRRVLRVGLANMRVDIDELMYYQYLFEEFFNPANPAWYCEFDDA